MPLETHNPLRDGIHHKILYSNFVAQTQALMQGKSSDVVKAELQQAGKSEADVEKLTPQKVPFSVCVGGRWRTRRLRAGLGLLIVARLGPGEGVWGRCGWAARAAAIAARWLPCIQ